MLGIFRDVLNDSDTHWKDRKIYAARELSPGEQRRYGQAGELFGFHLRFGSQIEFAHGPHLGDHSESTITCNLLADKVTVVSWVEPNYKQKEIKR